MSGPTNSPELRRAIESRDFELASRLVARTAHVPLQDELELTLLAAATAPELYEDLASGWLRRLASEPGGRVTYSDGLEFAAQVLAGVGDGSVAPAEARSALHGFLWPRESTQRDSRPAVLLASAALFLAAGMVAALVLLVAQ